MWSSSGFTKSRPPHPACLHFMASTTSRGVVHHILPIISRSLEWLDAHYFSYNSMPSYSYAPTSNLSVRMHILNILQRGRPQSNHKVPKRRRLVPSWDVVDDRPPHQLVHGETVQEVVWTTRRIGVIKSPQVVICEKKFYFGSFNFFCEKFPIKYCSTQNMWIRWSFRSISSSYFHRNIMYIWIFAHPRLTTYQLDCTQMLYKQK